MSQSPQDWNLKRKRKQKILFITKRRCLFVRRNNQRFELLSLPHELLSEVIRCIASSSSTCLALTKLCCKDLQKVGEEKYIYQHVCLKDFPIVAWYHKEEHDLFFNKYRSSKNPEALYRQGVIDYLGHQNTESAIEYLKEAVDYGHEGAYYIMAIIFLLSKDSNQKLKGETLLLNLKKKLTNSKTKVEEYRASIYQIMRQILWTPNLKLHKTNRDQIQGRRRSCTCRGWKEIDCMSNETTCEACQIDEEIAYICDLQDQIFSFRKRYPDPLP